MVKKSLACALFLGIAFPLSAVADDTLARFKGGIGVHPVSNVAGTEVLIGIVPTFPNVTRNVVRGVNPAGQIWVIDKLEATVAPNGHITVNGKGLILAGGNSAGRATGQFVVATLICEAAAPFTERNTNLTGVQLTTEGDFKIDDILSPAPPFDCASPMLLIRNAQGLTWFAVGILKEGND